MDTFNGKAHSASAPSHKRLNLLAIQSEQEPQSRSTGYPGLPELGPGAGGTKWLSRHRFPDDQVDAGALVLGDFPCAEVR